MIAKQHRLIVTRCPSKVQLIQYQQARTHKHAYTQDTHRSAVQSFFTFLNYFASWKKLVACVNQRMVSRHQVSPLRKLFLISITKSSFNGSMKQHLIKMYWSLTDNQLWQWHGVRFCRHDKYTDAQQDRVDRDFTRQTDRYADIHTVLLIQLLNA